MYCRCLHCANDDYCNCAVAQFTLGEPRWLRAQQTRVLASVPEDVAEDESQDKSEDDEEIEESEDSEDESEGKHEAYEAVIKSVEANMAGKGEFETPKRTT